MRIRRVNDDTLVDAVARCSATNTIRFMTSQHQSRRTFLKATGQLTVLGGVFTLGSCLGGCSDDVASVPLTGTKVTLTLSAEPGLQSVGGFIRRVFTGNNNNLAVIVVRTAEKKFQTMSTLCQHESGSVQAPVSGKAVCNLHAAQYSTSEGNFGANIGGQSAPNLQTFVTEFNESTGVITIHF
jgi:Rieske Fe-S protein